MILSLSSENINLDTKKWVHDNKSELPNIMPWQKINIDNSLEMELHDLPGFIADTFAELKDLIKDKKNILHLNIYGTLNNKAVIEISEKNSTKRERLKILNFIKKKSSEDKYKSNYLEMDYEPIEITTHMEDIYSSPDFFPTWSDSDPDIADGILPLFDVSLDVRPSPPPPPRNNFEPPCVFR